MPISKVKVLAERGRKKFEGITELAESIKKHGLINPILVDRSTSAVIAGERRLRACTVLSVVWNEQDEKSTPPDHPVRDILSGNIPVTYRDQLKGDKLKEIELEENVCRKELEWPEQIFLQEQIDTLKRSLYGDSTAANPDGWSLEKTANLVGEGRSAVSNKINFARELKKEDPSVLARLRNLPLTAAIKEYEQMKTAQKVERLHAQGSLTLNTSLLHGDSRSLIKTLPDNSIDLLLTDPPFGIPELTDSAGTSRGETTSYTAKLKPDDNLDQALAAKLIDDLAPEWFRVLKPSSHFYIFFAWEIYNDLRRSLINAGFEVCPVPIIWDKGRSTAPFRGYEPAPGYEPVLFGHKPPRAKRLNDACRMVFTYGTVSSSKKLHPFEKPQELLCEFIRLSTNIGDVILDTFGGSGSTIVAAASLGRSAIAFEKDKENFSRAQGRLTLK